MGVSDDKTITADLLRSGIVVLLGVDEVTELNVLDGHGDCESSVCWNSVSVCRTDEFARWDIAGRRNDTHDSVVT